MRIRLEAAAFFLSLLLGGSAGGQYSVNGPAAKPPVASFEVASVRPASEADKEKVAAVRRRSGGIPKVGPHVEGRRAEYNFMTLRALIANAYALKPLQITGPNWLGEQQYYIAANLPNGASINDAPEMLQALLKERFKLAVHRGTKEQPVLALVVANGGPKLRTSPAPLPLDEHAELKPHEAMFDTNDGPGRISSHGPGTSTIDMGTRGIFEQSVNSNAQTAHIEGKGVTMAGFANLLTQLMQMRGPGSRPVVDMTQLRGNYQVSLNISLASLMAFARAQIADSSGGAGSQRGTAPAAEATDPDGGTTLFKSLESLGLKLEQRKTPVEQLIVDHADKMPTENQAQLTAADDYKRYASSL